MSVLRAAFVLSWALAVKTRKATNGDGDDVHSIGASEASHLSQSKRLPASMQENAQVPGMRCGLSNRGERDCHEAGPNMLHACVERINRKESNCGPVPIVCRMSSHQDGRCSVPRRRVEAVVSWRDLSRQVVPIERFCLSTFSPQIWRDCMATVELEFLHVPVPLRDK